MHPAGSLILFTTLSGAGFGLLAFLGLGYPAVEGGLAFVFYAMAYALAAAGLVSSVFHLGHPERAWKAFTQWRSSWLSREAWLALAAMSAMGIVAIATIFGGPSLRLLGVIGAALSLATVAATSMIYAQLRTVPRWYHWSTPALFLAHALAAGALLSGQVAAAVPFLVLLGILQSWVWQDGDRRFASSGTTLGTATGLGGRGVVRAFEPPHTGPNYLTREMIHVVGRRHARKLRLIGLSLGVAGPILLLLLPFNHVFAGLAVISHLAGSLCNRWLFFAEAEHVVGLYYGREA